MKTEMKIPFLKNKKSAGFSAVELLATIFIAVVFLSAGYSLYGAIVSRSAVTRHRAQADNIAYDYIRRYESTVPTACVTTTPLNNVVVPSSVAGDLGKPTVTVSITCPNNSITLLSKVKVVVNYVEGGVQRNVEHEVFAAIQ
jgi:Tfp pilus assembly protein PilE